MATIESLTPIGHTGLVGPIRRMINLILALALSTVGIGGFVYLLFFCGWLEGVG